MNKIFKINKLLISSLFFLMILLQIEQKLLYAEGKKSTFLSPRSLGRGGTFVAANDSSEARRLNPASMVDRDKKFQLSFFEVDFFGGQEVLSTLNDILQISVTSGGFDFFRKFDKKFGKKQYLRGQGSFLNLRYGSFEFDPFVVTSTELELKNPAVPEAEWLSDSLMGANFSFAYPASKKVSLGLTLRPYYRLYLAGDMSFSELMDFLPPASKKLTDLSPLK